MNRFLVCLIKFIIYKKYIFLLFWTSVSILGIVSNDRTYLYNILIGFVFMLIVSILATSQILIDNEIKKKI